MVATNVLDCADLVLIRHYKAFTESAIVGLLLDLEGNQIVHESANTVAAASNRQVEDDMESTDTSRTLY